MTKDVTTEATSSQLDYAKNYERVMYGLERLTRRPPAQVIQMALCVNGNPISPKFTTDLADWLKGSWLSPVATLSRSLEHRGDKGPGGSGV